MHHKWPHAYSLNQLTRQGEPQTHASAPLREQQNEGSPLTAQAAHSIELGPHSKP
ncbi:MAG: hypothetical protein ACSLE5_03010 [Porticoccaceae bacterium]